MYVPIFEEIDDPTNIYSTGNIVDINRLCIPGRS